LSRKKKKRLPKGPKNPVSKGDGDTVAAGAATDVEALEKKARECLKRGDYRRAMEGYKRLMKVDAGAYGEHFLTACTGAFADFLRQAQPKSAEAVLRDLKERAPEPLLAMMRIRLALSTSQEGEAASAAAWLLASPDATPGERRFAADALVTIPPKERGQTECSETGLIDRALEDAAAGRFAEATTALRDVPRDSPFAHWRIFFKAVAAHGEGDAKTAEQALSKLDGACARVARAWIVPAADTLATAVALEGETKLAVNLPGLLRLDQRADHGAVFARLIEYGGAFPSVGCSLGATLTDYLCARISGARLDERLFEQLTKRVRRSSAPPIAVFVTGRFLFESLAKDPYLEKQDARLLEKAFPDVRAAFPAQADAAEALALYKYAVTLAENAEHGGPSSTLPLAADFLVRATKLSPDWELPFLELLVCYLALERAKECDDLLKAALRRFPESLEVLLKAGQVSLLRGRPQAALRYLLEMRARHPLTDKGCSEIINSAVMVCEQALGRKDPTAAAEMAEVAIGHARQSLAYVHTPDKILLQCGNLFETHLGEAAAKPYYDRAAALMAPDVFCYLRLVTGFFQPKKSDRTRKGYRLPKTFLESATLNQALAMGKFLDAMEPSLSDAAFLKCEEVLADYARSAVLEDPDWRVAVVPFARFLLDAEWYVEVFDEVAEAAKKRSAGDPLVRVLGIAADPSPAKKATLLKARKKLREEGFAAAVALCDATEKRLEDEPPGRDFSPRGGGDFEGDLPEHWPNEVEKALKALTEMAKKLPEKATKKKTAKKKTPKKKASVPKAHDKSPGNDPQLDLPF
jgi:tetratricopeptide (TPR) repeat protein